MIPANAVGKVMGKGGTNIANIQKVCIYLIVIFLLEVTTLLLIFNILKLLHFIHLLSDGPL